MDNRELLNDSEETLRIAFDGRLSKVWTSIPCKVISINWAEMTISAQPMIQGVVEDESGNTTYVNLPILGDVPIIFQSAGGFTITLPIKIGDECLIMLASRCIDAWWQSGTISVPMESRMHDLSDGFALIGPKSLPNVISNISQTGLQIRKDDGTSYIEMANDGKIKLVSSLEIDVTGNMKVTGTISATGDVIGNSATVPIHLTTHTHTSATPGNPTSGPLH